MPNDPQLTAAVVALLTTYLLHSTLLLGAVWLGFALTRSHSAPLQERLWKLAALAPLVTAPLQLAGADRFGDWSVWTLPAIALTADPNPVESTRREGEAPDVATGERRFDDAVAERNADAALVEIIPGPSSTDSAAELGLPIIEPAPAVTITPSPPMPNEDVAIEPFIPDDDWIAATPAVQAPSNVALPPLSDVETAVPTADRPTVAESRDAWRGPVSLVVAVLVLLGLIRLAWRSMLARHKLRRTETITDGALRIALDRLLTERAVRRPVRLAYSAAASEPAAGGVLRWVIVVPPGIEQRLSAAEQHALLAHEVAHLVRRDPLWLWIGTALCSCLPFQLLNFLAVRRWRQASEELSDDWAIAGGVRPLTLANCLTRVAEWKLSPMPVGLTADIGKSRFARRIGRLINGETHADRWSRPGQRRLLLAFALGCVALLTCCGPRMQAGATRASPEVQNATVVPVVETDSRTSDVDGDLLITTDGFTADPVVNEQDPTPTPAEAETELTSLLADLQHVEELIGELGNDPEINAVRARLRARLESLRTRMQPEIEREEETANDR